MIAKKGERKGEALVQPPTLRSTGMLQTKAAGMQS